MVHCNVYDIITSVTNHQFYVLWTMIGFVTDHYNLLEDQSRLYHYLALFEPDTKRKLAMESKRIELLQPLLSQLSLTAFEVIHKQVTYIYTVTYFVRCMDCLRDRSVSMIGFV